MPKIKTLYHYYKTEDWLILRDTQTTKTRVFIPGMLICLTLGGSRREVKFQFYIEIIQAVLTETSIKNLLNNDALSHVFSISVRYFIDYNQVKNKF